MIKKKWTTLRKEQYRRLKEEIAKVEGDSVCVLGYKVAEFEEPLIARFPNQTIIDIEDHPEVTFVADMEKPLDLPDNSFNLILSMNTHEHIFHARELTKECYRILKPGGTLLGSTPMMLRLHQEPRDFHRFTDYALDKMFFEAGFRRIDIKRIGTHLDTIKLVMQHHFQELFTLSREKGGSLKVKIAWNLWKLFNRVFKKTMERNTNHRSPLGYFFVVKK